MINVTILFCPDTYKITCLKNERIYVGESQNVLHRLGRHTADLQENRHDCAELQQDFNKYKKNAFKFESLTVDPKYADYRLRKQLEKEELAKFTNYYNQDPNIKRKFKTYTRIIKIRRITFEGLRQAAKKTTVLKITGPKKGHSFLF